MVPLFGAGNGLAVRARAASPPVSPRAGAATWDPGAPAALPGAAVPEVYGDIMEPKWHLRI
jgi:hypothetical protein